MIGGVANISTCQDEHTGIVSIGRQIPTKVNIGWTGTLDEHAFFFTVLAMGTTDHF
jgi:hypothetical protein